MIEPPDPSGVQLTVTTIVAIANILLVGLTAVYAYLTRQMVLQMRASREPSVFVDLEFPESMARVSVGNTGLTPAKNIRFRIDDKVPWLGEQDKPRGLLAVNALKTGVSFLPPGRVLKYYVGMPDWKRAGPEATITVAVDFESEAGATFAREYVLDLAQYSQVLFESFRDPTSSVADAIKEAERSRRASQTAASIVSPFFPPLTKTCPMCAEKIPLAARKCSHCGEMIGI
jgi:hypothetical protein